MLVELKTKSQVTIPKEIVEKLDLSKGDRFEIYEEEGKIVLVPVVVYPEYVMEDLKNSIYEVKKQIENGEKPLFDNIEDLFEELDK